MIEIFLESKIRVTINTFYTCIFFKMTAIVSYNSQFELFF